MIYKLRKIDFLYKRNNSININIIMFPLNILSTTNTNTNNDIPILVKIKKICDNNHNHCKDIISVANKNIDIITQEYFNDFFSIIKGNNYNCCISSYANNKSKDIKNFIIKCSEKLVIPTWESIITYLTDDELLVVIKNQHKLDNKFINNTLNMDNILNGYGNRGNFINVLLGHPIKIKCFEYIIMLFNIDQFVKYLNKSIKISAQTYDNVIIKYIESNKEKFKLIQNKECAIKIINYFSAKSQIIKNIYPIISPSLSKEQKIDIFNKSISLLDNELLFLLLENKDIVPTIETINKLTEKCYVRPEGAVQNKQVADIIDLLCEYGLEINKNIVLKLLDHGCYVNNLEKYNIKVDSEILAKCANYSYYPYKFDIKPDTGILIKECTKHDNLNTIKKLKEFGGIYTIECLEEACKVHKNGRVIKFLLTECGIKASEKSLDNFQEAYKIEALDLLMKNFKLNNPEIKNTLDEKFKKYVEIDKNSTMTITPRNIEIDINDDLINYELKSKIKKFFNYNKKTIKYNELYQIMLKYLISNNLIVSKYFIINEQLSNLLKINHCTIMHIDQINNILTYFIDPVKN